ncbi:MAG TPA: hypothetical protein VNC39_01630 [Acidocella sp.]|jgi:hypothetical protein|uniref:head-tail joining protein n=1 Tax=Acidocella sp. TaxID=50710 RepID=UPI002C1F9B0E|nr:hypothetical protein [Acidocella sp.]HVE20651.1 hypothetical protein [Acidocella sp.]
MIDFDQLVLGPCFDAFAQPATYLPARGAAVPVNGIFNRYSTLEQIDNQTAMMVTVVKPTLALRLCDLPGVKLQLHDQVKVAGVLWEVAAPPEFDGHGQALLTLANTRA